MCAQRLSKAPSLGWTGLAPIALLIENVLGFEIMGSGNQISWTIKRTDRHGIMNIRLRNQAVSLIYEKSRVTVECEKPFILELTIGGETVRHEIQQSTEIEF